MTKLNVTVASGPKEGNDKTGFTIPMYVSITEDDGLAATGLRTQHFELQLLHPMLNREERRLFQLEMSSVKEVSHGYYRIDCKNAVGTGFLSGRVVMSLKVRKSGPVAQSGQTLVTFSP